MSTQHSVPSLKALLQSLILGVLGVVLLLSILGTAAVASASQGEDRLNNSTRETLGSPASPATTTVRITKTVEPSDPDTGGVVSICFVISGLGPRNIDVVLAHDVSGSMLDPAVAGGIQTRLEASQVAAKAFVNYLQAMDRAAVVTYSVTAHLAQPLTMIKSSVISATDALTATATAETNIGEGIKVGHGELITSPRYMPESVKSIILLSDGYATLPDGTAEEYARQQALAAAEDDIKIYTIGFGEDANEQLLQEIAQIGGGQYYFIPDSGGLEEIYLAIALELHSLVITDMLIPDVETDCSQWPDTLCVKGASGVTTITFPISNSLLTSELPPLCFTATVNLDPGYEGPVNLPASGFSYKDPAGQPITRTFVNPRITVGGRKIAGYVFYDANADGNQDVGEVGAPDVIVRTNTGLVTTTDISGSYVLRTASQPPLSVTVQVPGGYIATTPLSESIPSTTGIYDVDFGIWRAFYPTYLPVLTRDHPLPSIINGGFEKGWTGWAYGGELYKTVTPANPHSGNFSALLGDPTYECEDGVPIGSAWIQQAFFVPRTDEPRLSFWYNMWTQDKNPYLTGEFDSFDVKINGVVITRSAKITGTYGCDPQVEADLGWRIKAIDLSDYEGKRITIRFENRSHPDGWFNTWTYVDDVRFIP